MVAESVVTAIAAATVTPIAAAAEGLRRHQRTSLRSGPDGRARIVRSSRNRRRSSARASAVAYRCAGSRTIALSTIVSMSCAISGTSCRGAGGS